jgi:hypothetical protein
MNEIDPCRAESRGSIVTRVRLPFLALYSGGDGPFRKRVTNLPRRRVRMLPPMIGWGVSAARLIFEPKGTLVAHWRLASSWLREVAPFRGDQMSPPRAADTGKRSSFARYPYILGPLCPHRHAVPPRCWADIVLAGVRCATHLRTKGNSSRPLAISLLVVA